MRKAVSAIIIAKNAEPLLAECLRSISWVDEIVVLDSCSEDRTCDIAREFGAKVFETQDWPGFGPQRQKAQSLASHDWVFMIDVDEQVSAELRSSIETLLENPDPAKVYSFDRLSNFFGRFIRTSGWHPDWVERLYNKEHFSYNDAAVHERVDCRKDQVDKLHGYLLHYTATDYQDFMRKSLRYSGDWAQARYQRGKRTSIPGIIMHSLGTILVKYLLKRGFMDGRHGLLLALTSGIYTFHKYTQLWLLQQEKH